MENSKKLIFIHIPHHLAVLHQQICGERDTHYPTHLTDTD